MTAVEQAAATSARIFSRTYWNVERDGSWIVGFPTSEKAHAQAKPRGFRTKGTVIRHDVTKSWVDDGDTTISTETITRTVEAAS